MPAPRQPRVYAGDQRRPGDTAVTIGGVLFAIGAGAVLIAFIGYLVFGVEWDHLTVVVPVVGLLMAVGLAAALTGLLRQARSRSVT